MPAGLLGPDLPAWLDRFRSDLDNLRAALSWSLGANAAPPERTELGLRFVAALGPFRYWQSQFAEGRRWIDLALSQSRGKQSARARQPWSRPPCSTTTSATTRLAEHHALDSLAMARTSGDAATEGHARFALSLLAGRRGEHRAAASHAALALAIFRQLDDALWTGMALTRLGVATHGGGDPAAAKPLHEEALRLWRAVGSATGVAVALGNLGDVARELGALAEAAERVREGLEIAWALRMDWVVVEDLVFLADVAQRAGRFPEAARLLGAAERLRETIGHALFGNLPMVVETCTAATRLALGTGQFAIAWGRRPSVVERASRGDRP